MGASIAVFIGRLFGCSWPDWRVLLAAGAGAGLATAFNAPIAGAIFVLEELVQRFEHRIAIAALAASATAISVARLFWVTHSISMSRCSIIRPSACSRCFTFLVEIAGLLAIAYNRSLLATLAAAERLKWLPVELRAGLIGGAVGALGWFSPALIGGGDDITARTLLGGELFIVVATGLASSIWARCDIICSRHTRAVDSDAKCNALHRLASSAKSSVPVSNPQLPPDFEGQAVGLAGRNIEPVQSGLALHFASEFRGRAICAFAGSGGAIWPAVRDGMPRNVTRAGHSACGIRHRWDGRIFCGRSPRAANRHRADHRDDCECHNAPTHARCMLYRHACADAIPQCTDLRLLARAYSST